MLPIYRAVLISRGVGTKGTKELTMVTMVGKPPGPPGWCYTGPGTLEVSKPHLRPIHKLDTVSRQTTHEHEGAEYKTNEQARGGEPTTRKGEGGQARGRGQTNPTPPKHLEYQMGDNRGQKAFQPCQMAEQSSTNTCVKT